MKQSKSFMSELNATCSNIVREKRRCNTCGDLSNVESKTKVKYFPQTFHFVLMNMFVSFL